MAKKKRLTYKDAGLDLNLYDQAMSRLPALMQKTHTPRVLDLPGGFAGLFRLGRSRKFSRNYDDPVLVSGTDGVGTKLKVAALAGVYETIGIDLVAMSVNDCLCLGAEPLFFLDYVALPRDDPDRIAHIVAGVCSGCEEAGCALLGGETAVMPDLYEAGDFDLAGFCVGVVERKQIIDGQRIKPGDLLLGLESSGLHSNGYSLVRKAVFEAGKLGINDQVAELGQTVGQALLTPTRIYVRPVLNLLQRKRSRSVIGGMAHITGGGLAGNLERILPVGARAEIDRTTWGIPPVFGWIEGLGNIDREEMFRVFNMGIGFVLVVRERAIDDLQDRLSELGVPSHCIGRVVAGERGVAYLN
ncbi:MAG: phosphoribosylformylglycinamidine cyclo-ligase [Planctomycetaceae bacterium]|nr:phosphoribosylformylglycinamidine cyclo-ligase [Planctomycetaceae bacterium]